MAKESRLRAVLPLLKATIVERTVDGFKLAIGGSTTITVKIANMSVYDIRDGDVLTLYTEVLFAKPQERN